MKRFLFLVFLMAVLAISGCSKKQSRAMTKPVMVPVETPKPAEKVDVETSNEIAPTETKIQAEETERESVEEAETETEIETKTETTAKDPVIEDFFKDGEFDIDSYAKALGYNIIDDPYGRGVYYGLTVQGTAYYAIFKRDYLMNAIFNKDGHNYRFSMNENDPSISGTRLCNIRYGGKSCEESESFITDQCNMLKYYANTDPENVDLYSLGIMADRSLSVLETEEEYDENGLPKGVASGTDASKGYIKAYGEQ